MSTALHPILSIPLALTGILHILQLMLFFGSRPWKKGYGDKENIFLAHDYEIIATDAEERDAAEPEASVPPDHLRRTDPAVLGRGSEPAPKLLRLDPGGEGTAGGGPVMCVCVYE